MALGRSRFATRKPPRAGRPAWKVADEYRRWLRKLPCARCETVGTIGNPIIAAHVDLAGKGARDAKGASSKVADRFCLPLCNDCHREQTEVLGWPAFEKLLPMSDAEALSGVYWTEWPGRREWERQQAAGVEARA